MKTILLITVINVVYAQIKMTDIQSLTFYKDKMTTGYRLAPIEQLECISGDACNNYEPNSVQCSNIGIDDNGQIQWDCHSDLANQYRFGKLSVSCEGYQYPSDPYILIGSCGLQYELFTIKEIPGLGMIAYIILSLCVLAIVLFICCSIPWNKCCKKKEKIPLFDNYSSLNSYAIPVIPPSNPHQYVSLASAHQYIPESSTHQYVSLDSSQQYNSPAISQLIDNRDIIATELIFERERLRCEQQKRERDLGRQRVEHERERRERERVEHERERRERERVEHERERRERERVEHERERREREQHHNSHGIATTKNR